jgi:hypothetical protein
MKKIWWFGYGGGFAGEMEASSTCCTPPAARELKAGVRAAGALWRRKL